MTAVSGTVINIHQHGATVRLLDGTLVAVAASELSANRPTYVSSHASRTPLTLLLERRGAHATVALRLPDGKPESTYPNFRDAAFETQMNAFLKSTHEWEPSDRPAPAERHFIRKKRRAALFEPRNRGT